MFDLFVFEFIDYMRCWDFLVDVVRILFQQIRFYNFPQIPLLCDHQELTCTPKDPPPRVDMNERSLFFIRKYIELSTKPFEDLLVWNLLKTAHVLLYILTYLLLDLSIAALIS